MNAQQAKQIPITIVLEKMGCQPTKTIYNSNWYISPFRKERTSSFKVDTKKNIWFDYGLNIGGNILDFVMKKTGCSFTEALLYLKDYSVSFSFHQQQETTLFSKPEKKHYKINEIKPISTPNLISYLESRCITDFIDLAEIHYTIIVNNVPKNYYGVCFKNDSGGYEVNSKYSKISLIKKDCTTIKNNTNILLIFESFLDYISYKQIHSNNHNFDFLILNTVALVESKLNFIDTYETIHLYLDNDSSGNKYAALLIEKFKLKVIDCRELFRGFKDYNDYLIYTKKLIT